jgi:hypothetical protein
MSTAPNTEKVKRLPPKPEVLRELFLKSGNMCAFPDCSHPIMNQEGEMVAQVCHIEAAETGGERFNPDQTNEQRRAFSNLILLCYEHHVKTNDVAKYDVKRMQEMKAAHEKKVFDFIEKTLLTVADQTKLSDPRPAKDCSRMNRLLDWKHSAEELAQDAKTINGLLDRLGKVPKPARQLLAVIVERASFCGSPEMVLAHEVQHACGLSTRTMEELGTILEKYGFIEIGEPDDYGHGRLFLPEWEGWPVWADFRRISEAGYATLEELIVNLNFSFLDEPSN